ncbi:MAG TPA: ATP-binding protein [Phycisphaerae bacterium]|nr:ATP-binding protein [Phycisphaerae bacterium]
MNGWWVALAAGAGLGLAAWGVRRALRPARRHHAAVDRRVIEIAQLAGGLAHEIRNPLSTLLLNLRLLEEDLAAAFDEEAPTLRRALLRIGSARGEAERLQRQLDEFLLLVRPVSLRTEPLDLNVVVDELVDFFTPEAQRHHLTLRWQPAPEPLRCDVDAQALKQALLNLFINAQQATPADGEIIVTARREGAAARLDIADTGCGMSADVAAQALQAFYSTKPNGSGLGLATTLRIVEAHGGTLHFDSQPGVGTGFEIRLPLAPLRPPA